MGHGAAEAPDGYDEEEARLLLESYGYADIPDDNKVNIIAFMLESYVDMSEFEVIEFKEDVYGTFHMLQEESVAGRLVSNVFAGMTIDTERLFLTGNTILTNIDSALNSHVRYMNAQGYHTEGFTAVAGWFYDRKPINAHLGFSEHYFLEDIYGSNQYDYFFFRTVMEKYEARDKSIPYFSFNLSAQNHGPYPSTWTRELHVISQRGLSTEGFNILNNYLYGISRTTEHLRDFIDGLRDDPDPVVVLVCGDHMPWLGNNDFIYTELGINLDRSTEEGFYNYYSTPYFIWANDAAKEVLGRDFTGEGRSFSPGFLMGELFRLCSWDGDGYIQAQQELQTYVDVIHEPAGMFRENGVLTTELSPAASEAYERFRKIEFFRLRNFDY